MRVRALAVAFAAVMIFAACGSNGSKKGTSTTGAQKLTGTVHVFNAMEPQEATALQKVVDADINSKVGYKALIEQSSDFETQAKIRIQGGNPPEIILYPQPGTVVEQAKPGKIKALEDLGHRRAGDGEDLRQLLHVARPSTTASTTECRRTSTSRA